MSELPQFAEAALTSPWLYVALAIVSLLDSFLPAVPSEPVLVVAGTAAAAGEASLVLVIVATAVGAYAGDLVPYVVGKRMAAPVLARLPSGTRRRRVHDRISAELHSHAGLVLITSRFVPVGRYLVTLSAGMSALPVRIFLSYSGIAVVTWSTYVVLAGYLGGKTMQDNPVLAVGIGMVLAGFLSAAISVALRIGGRTVPSGSLE